jgi:hypothetical protein
VYADHVLEKLRELEESVSLKQVQEIFDRKEYSLVVQKLEPFVECSVTIPIDVRGEITLCLPLPLSCFMRAYMRCFI